MAALGKHNSTVHITKERRREGRELKDSIKENYKIPTISTCPQVIKYDFYVDR
jgi:hypothetical protein